MVMSSSPFQEITDVSSFEKSVTGDTIKYKVNIFKLHDFVKLLNNWRTIWNIRLHELLKE